MDYQNDEWQRTGATLSDKTARQEFGLTQDEIYDAIDAGTLPGSFAALLLCTCHRWDRVTAKLIAAIADSGTLTSAELDELADSLLSDEVVVEFPVLIRRPRIISFSTWPAPSGKTGSPHSR